MIFWFLALELSVYIGLTTALELRRRYTHAQITVLEKEEALGMHASGRNSGVLHCGIYYTQDTLKAKMCSNGAKRMMQKTIFK